MKDIFLSLITIPGIILVFIILGFLSTKVKSQLKFYKIALILFFIASMPISNYILSYPLLKFSSKYDINSSYKLDMIFLLTGGIYKNLEDEWMPSKNTYNRALLAKMLSNKTSTKLLISGGKTIKDAPSESSVVKDYFNLSNSIIEQESLNTYQSAFYLKDNCFNYTNPILLVTGELHSLRSFLTFKSQGCNVLTYPYKKQLNHKLFFPKLSSLAQFNNIIYEYCAISFYLITGKIKLFRF